MSYQEKKSVSILVTGVLVLAGYCIYALNKYLSGTVEAGDLMFWTGTILTFVCIGIFAMLITQIIFNIAMAIAVALSNRRRGEKESSKTVEALELEDKRIRLIDFKSMKIGFAITGIGLVASLVSLALGYSPAVVLNILFLSCSTGSLLEGFQRLFYYRKGI
jgi:hypothetical protein